MNNTTMLYSGLMGAGVPIFVYIVGIVLAIIWWSRWPQCCALVLGGLLVLLLTSVMQPFFAQQIIGNRSSSTTATIGQQMVMMTVIVSLFRALGTGLLIWAAFAGREAPFAQQSRFETLPPRVP
jgi:hypothetical protein